MAKAKRTAIVTPNTGPVSSGPVRLTSGLNEAIRSTPDDDLPRLAAADWYDEHKSAARAEFIRLQIARARLPRYSEEAIRLEARERILDGDAGALAELPVEVPGLKWHVRRGFPDRLVCDLQTFLEQASRIAKAPVSDLMILLPMDPDPLAVRKLLSIESLSRLLRLHLVGKLTAAETTAVATEARLAGLISFGFYGEDACAALAASEVLAGLKSLTLNETTIRVADVGPLVRSRPFAGLTNLSLDRCGLADKAAASLVKAPQLQKLESLSLACNRVEEDTLALLCDTRWLPDLRELNLSNFSGLSNSGRSRIPGAALAELLSSPRFRSLSRLEVYAAEIPTAAFDRTPADPGPPGLTLVISDHDGTAAEFLASPLLARCSALTLDAGQNFPDLLRALAENPAAGNLRSLQLVAAHQNPDISALIQSQHLAGLVALGFGGYGFTRLPIASLIDSAFATTLLRFETEVNARLPGEDVRRIVSGAIFPSMLLFDTVLATGVHSSEDIASYRERFGVRGVPWLAHYRFFH